MPPVMRKLVDVATAIGLTAAVVFVIIFTNSFLTARGGSVHGFNTWYAFILRPDILGTMILTALVTIGYVMWQQNGRPRGTRARRRTVGSNVSDDPQTGVGSLGWASRQLTNPTLRSHRRERCRATSRRRRRGQRPVDGRQVLVEHAPHEVVAPAPARVARPPGRGFADSRRGRSFSALSECVREPRLT